MIILTKRHEIKRDLRNDDGYLTFELWHLACKMIVKRLTGAHVMSKRQAEMEKTRNHILATAEKLWKGSRMLMTMLDPL